MELIEDAKRLYEMSRMTEEQLGALNEHHTSLLRVMKNLEEIGSGNGFSMLGNGIFVPSRIDEGNFVVNVGAGVMVEKNNDEVKGIVASQIKKVHETKMKLEEELEKMSKELERIIEQVEKKKTI